jgi:hydrogenase maturation protease
VEVLALHQLTPELMEPVSRAGRTIFLDAAAGGEPGTVRKRTVEPAAEGSGFTHQSTPGALLAGALALFGRAPQAVLYSIPGGNFEFGEALTPSVQSALEEVVAEITAACQGRE